MLDCAKFLNVMNNIDCRDDRRLSACCWSTLDDDVRITVAHNRFLRWMFSSGSTGRTSFLDDASNLTSDIAAVIKEHDDLEGRGHVALEDYVKPTGQGFRRVFAYRAVFG